MNIKSFLRALKAFYDLLQTLRAFGEAFANAGVHEPQARASEAFTRFGDFHRSMERDGISMIRAVKPVSINQICAKLIIRDISKIYFIYVAKMLLKYLEHSFYIN